MSRRILVAGVVAALAVTFAPPAAAAPPRYQYPFRDPGCRCGPGRRPHRPAHPGREDLAAAPVPAGHPAAGHRLFKAGTEALHGVAWSNDTTTAATSSPPTAPLPAGGRPGQHLGPRPDRAGRLGRRRRGARATTPGTRECGGSTSGRRWSTCCATRGGAATRRATREDPLLTGAIATAYGSGLEGADPDHLKTAPDAEALPGLQQRGRAATRPRRRCRRGCSTSTTGRRSEPALQAGRRDRRDGVLQPDQRAARHGQPGPRRLRADLDRPAAVQRQRRRSRPDNLTGSQHYYATQAEADAAVIKAGLNSFTLDDANRPPTIAAIKRRPRPGAAHPGRHRRRRQAEPGASASGSASSTRTAGRTATITAADQQPANTAPRPRRPPPRRWCC